MTTQLLIEDRFVCTPKELFDMLSNNDFDDELMKSLNVAKELQLKSDKAGGTEYKIRLTSSDPIPAIAKKFIGEHLSYVEHRIWNNAGLSNTWTITPEIKGATCEAKGTTEIVVDGHGCLRRTKGSISVSIPLIGKKIEEMVLQSITDTFKKNADFCRSYIDKK